MRFARLAVLATFAMAFLAAPLAAQPQSAAGLWRIGDLGRGSRDRLAHVVEALESGLRDLGYIEGRNVIFDHRFAHGRLERVPDLAAEMVRSKLDVIVASTPDRAADEVRARDQPQDRHGSRPDNPAGGARAGG